MSDFTPRLDLPIPELGDAASIEDAVHPMADVLDQLVAPLLMGLAADRPAAAIPRRFYFGTDDGRLSIDTGSQWVLVAPRGAASGALSGNFPAPDIAEGAVTSAKLAAGAALANLDAGSVTRAKLAVDALALPVVTSLPTSGNFAGRTVLLRYPSSDVRLMCVYDITQGDGRSWSVIGGGPLVGQADADFGIVGGDTSWKVGAGPSFSNLLPGAYWAEWGCMMYWNQVAPEQRSFMSIDAVGAGAVDALSVTGSASGAFALDSRGRGRLVTITGSNCGALYRSTGIPTSFVQRWVALHPRRLG